jgi:DNA modification methylase
MIRMMGGDCRALLRTLADRSVPLVMTSPPFFGLRKYPTAPLVWGDDPACVHDWQIEPISADLRRGWPLCPGAMAAWEWARERVDCQRRDLCRQLERVPTSRCTVLDIFAGAFTVPLVADRLQRDAIGFELSPEYVSMGRDRLIRDVGMLAEIVEGPP